MVETEGDILRLFPVEKGAPRPVQADAIRRIDAAFRSGKRIVALQAPVGSGKTFVAETLARAEAGAGGSSYFITPQRQHQDQLSSDFPSPETEALKGRANYPCDHKDAKKWMTAANGVCRQKGQGILSACVDGAADGRGLAASKLELPHETVKCPYFKQARKALECRISSFNFASFLYQQRLGRFGSRSLMVVDECHNVESEIVKFMELSLSERTLKPVGVRIDREISTKDSLVRWLEELDIEGHIRKWLGPAASSDGGVAEGLTPQETDRLKGLLERLESFRERLDATEWVVETVDGDDEDGEEDTSRRIRCRPLSARPFMKSLFLSKAGKFLFMSGTILDARLWCRNLGLNPAEVEYIEEPCTFPAENRPIVLDYAGNMGFKYFEGTKPRLLEKVSEILERHKGQRGIIHCQSFKLGDALRALGSPRLLYQRDFENDKTRMLAEHDRRADAVIVAPGMSEGVDLVNDRARFQIIAKIPWPGLGDKLIARRKELYEPYYQWLAAIKFCQSVGRIVRHDKDHGVTYVIDQGFEQFRRSCGRLVPQWMKDAIRAERAPEARGAMMF